MAALVDRRLSVYARRERLLSPYHISHCGYHHLATSLALEKISRDMRMMSFLVFPSHNDLLPSVLQLTFWRILVQFQLEPRPNNLRSFVIPFGGSDARRGC